MPGPYARVHVIRRTLHDMCQSIHSLACMISSLSHNNLSSYALRVSKTRRRFAWTDGDVILDVMRFYGSWVHIDCNRKCSNTLIF